MALAMIASIGRLRASLASPALGGAARSLAAAAHGSVPRIGTLQAARELSVRSTRPIGLRLHLDLGVAALGRLRGSLVAPALGGVARLTTTSGGRLPPIPKLRTVIEVLSVHEQHARSMRPKDLSSCWNRLAKLVKSDAQQRKWLRDRLRREPTLLQPLLDATLQQLPRFEPWPLSNTTHGLATLVDKARLVVDEVTWERLAARSVESMGAFNPQDLANTAWAFAKTGQASPALFEAIVAASVPRLRDFKPQALANTAWSFATAGHASPALFEAIAAASVPRLRDFNPQNLANTAWAYAALDAPSAALFGDSRFVDGVVAVERAFSSAQLSQLHQWLLWHEERGEAWPRLPAPLAERCRAAFCAVEGAPSRLQRDVVRALSALGWQPREEVRTDQGYSLDAVVRVDGRDVGVEVDGPSHFVGREPTGATMLKRRQLRAAGWPLLAVPYWEWNELKGDAARQSEYLSKGVREVVAAAPAA